MEQAICVQNTIKYKSKQQIFCNALINFFTRIIPNDLVKIIAQYITNNTLVCYTFKQKTNFTIYEIDSENSKIDNVGSLQLSEFVGNPIIGHDSKLICSLDNSLKSIDFLTARVTSTLSKDETPSQYILYTQKLYASGIIVLEAQDHEDPDHVQLSNFMHKTKNNQWRECIFYWKDIPELHILKTQSFYQNHDLRRLVLSFQQLLKICPAKNIDELLMFWKNWKSMWENEMYNIVQNFETIHLLEYNQDTKTYIVMVQMNKFAFVCNLLYSDTISKCEIPNFSYKHRVVPLNKCLHTNTARCLIYDPSGKDITIIEFNNVYNIFPAKTNSIVTTRLNTFDDIVGRSIIPISLDYFLISNHMYLNLCKIDSCNTIHITMQHRLLTKPFTFEGHLINLN